MFLLYCFCAIAWDNDPSYVHVMSCRSAPHWQTVNNSWNTSFAQCVWGRPESTQKTFYGLTPQPCAIITRFSFIWYCVTTTMTEAECVSELTGELRVYIVRIWGKIDGVVPAPHCFMMFGDNEYTKKYITCILRARHTRRLRVCFVSWKMCMI